MAIGLLSRFARSFNALVAQTLLNRAWVALAISESLRFAVILNLMALPYDRPAEAISLGKGSGLFCRTNIEPSLH